MERTITVKGNGSLSVRPDWICLDIRLETRNPAYADLVREDDLKLSRLRDALSEIGIPEDDLRTLQYGIHPEYTSRMEENGEYREVFQGFLCMHSLQLAFPFCRRELDRVLSALFSCQADPGLQIRFTVRDPDALRSDLLAAAAKDARLKAEALCGASGVQLGPLLRIRSGDLEPNLYSPTMLDMEEAAGLAKASARSFVPDTITSTDTAVFVWAIE